MSLPTSQENPEARNCVMILGHQECSKAAETKRSVYSVHSFSPFIHQMAPVPVNKITLEER